MYSSSAKKSALRKFYLEERMSFSEEEIAAYSKIISENVVKYFDFSTIKRVHCFLSIKKLKEIDMSAFIHYCWNNDIKVFVPKIFNKKIISVEINAETEMIENSWEISEPKSNEDCSEFLFDMVITPLIYCDQNGNRVGYGKGFYDQFFETINTNAQKVGVGLFSPNENVADVWEKDIPLNYLVTPVEVLSF